MTRLRICLCLALVGLLVPATAHAAPEPGINLTIPFRQLQMEMTGPDHLSLGQAIQKLRSGTTTTTATTEVHHAEIEANEDLKVATVKVEPKHKKHGDDRQ